MTGLQIESIPQADTLTTPPSAFGLWCIIEGSLDREVGEVHAMIALCLSDRGPAADSHESLLHEAEKNLQVILPSYKDSVSRT